MENKQGKKIMLVSSGRYRGVDIYETPAGFAVCLGTYVFSSFFLEAIRIFIDHWYDLRKN